MKFLGLSLILLGTLFQTDTWQWVKTVNGISISHLKDNSDGLIGYKCEMVMDQPMKQVEGYLDNLEDYPRWQENMTELKVIEKDNNVICYYYLFSDLPWPVSDREMVIKSTKSSSKGKIEYHNWAINSEYESGKTGVVRETNAQGYWAIIEISPNRTKVIYSWKGRNSTALPNWLVQEFITTGPLKTMKNLKNL